MKRTFTKHVFMRASVMLLMTMLTSLGAWATVPPLSGSGTANDPYVIDCDQDWNTFAYEGNAAIYWASGVHVKLGADIGTTTPVTATVGTSTHKYQGIFNGNGKELDIDLHIDEDYAAPFRYVDGATIKLLRVWGNVYTNGQYGGGLIGNVSGNNVEVKYCTNYVNIKNRTAGDRYHGGFVGKVEDGSQVTLTDCKYSGTIIRSDEAGYFTAIPSKCAGFVGTRGDTGGVTITNCFMDGTQNVSDGDVASGSRIFCISANSAYLKITNSYYTRNYGLIAQGTAKGSMTNAQLTAALGSAWYNAEPIITPKNVAIATVTGVQSLYFNNGSLTIDFTVTAADGTVLNHDTDIYTTYIDNKDDSEYSYCSRAGTHTYTLKVRGKGDYNGTNTSVTFKVTDGKMNSNVTELFDGVTYEVDKDVSITERITVNGTVVLSIPEGKTLTASKGIELSDGNQLTINGPGTLLINNCDENKSGIGAWAVGTLIINSGTINVTGGSNAAGIGGGSNSSADGTITINGGVVNATGGDGGAGIGGGRHGDCGTITINGGQVTATGGSIAAGIGPHRSNNSGTVTLGWTNATDFIEVTAGANYSHGGYSTGIATLAFATGDHGKFIIDGENIAATTTNILAGCKITPKTDAMDNDIAYATISGVNSDYQYTGTAIIVNPSLTDVNGNALVEGTHYTTVLRKSNNDEVSKVENDYQVTDADTYTFTFTGMSDYAGTSKTLTFKILALAKPTNLKQTDYSETSATLSWTKKGSETKWTVEYSTDNTFASGVTSVNVTNTSIVLDGLTAEQTYYARVKAVVGDGGSDWSNTVTFYTTAKSWIGCGAQYTFTDPYLTYTNYKYSLSQQIYTAAEMGSTTSLVESLDFMLTAYPCTRTFDIYMVHTDKASFTANNDWISYTDDDKVFSGNVTFGENVWTTITFDKKFVYNGTQNVALIVVDKTGSVNSGNIAQFLSYKEDDYYMSIVAKDSNPIDITSANGSRDSHRSQIRLVKSDVSIVSLADDADNTATLNNNDGENSIVTLTDRTIYCDGDWNTLCLPFNMTAVQIATSPLAGLTIKEMLPTSSLDNNGLLTLNFQTVTTIEAGKPYIVKYTEQAPTLLIHNAADWNTFASNVSGGTTYEGQIVKLADDFDNSTAVTTMVGDPNNTKFKGTFDGNGKTLNIALTPSVTYGAPFRSIDGATIKNLKVEGTISSSQDRLGGIVGSTHGDVTIENCECKVAITSAQATSYIGGIVYDVDDGTATIKNCLFSGSLSGTYNGGIVNHVDNAIANISNCLFAPSSIATADNNSQVILRAKYSSGSFSIQNCYYNAEGAKYGNTNGGTAAATDNDLLLADLGSGWEISGGNVVPKMNMPVPDIVNPVFTGVTINAAAPTEVTSNDGQVNFMGQYSPFTIDDSNIKSIILLGSNNKLGYSSNPRTLRAFRAHFFIPTTATARSFELNFGDDDETTGVFQIENGELKVKTLNSGWYTLGGLKLQGEPTEKGVYIYNGKKVVLK